MGLRFDLTMAGRSSNGFGVGSNDCRIKKKMNKVIMRPDTTVPFRVSIISLTPSQKSWNKFLWGGVRGNWSEHVCNFLQGRISVEFFTICILSTVCIQMYPFVSIFIQYIRTPHFENSMKKWMVVGFFNIVFLLQIFYFLWSVMTTSFLPQQKQTINLLLPIFIVVSRQSSSSLGLHPHLHEGGDKCEWSSESTPNGLFGNGFLFLFSGVQ